MEEYFLTLTFKTIAPKSFCFNKNQIKAFVLGADPTNYSDHGREVNLNFAFGIGQNAGYFWLILENLKQLGFHLEDLYIQNLLPDYQVQETSDNKSFIADASNNTKKIASEFNKYDPSKKLSVFLTAEDIYKAVLNDNEKKISAEEIYKLEIEIPIPANMNKLSRPLIPLFRHQKYLLSEWPEYTKWIKSYVNRNK